MNAPLTETLRSSKHSDNHTAAAANAMPASWARYLGDIDGGMIRLRGIVNAELGRLHDSGDGLHCTITLHNDNLFKQVLQQGSLGAAESYIRGDWDVDDLVTLIRILCRNRLRLDRLDRHPLARISQALLRLWYAGRRNDKAGSQRNIADHYDLSNDFFKLFLDQNLMYSSAVFEHPGQTLEDASNHKLALICGKLKLNSHDHVLEIGSGWGGFAIYAALHYGCKVTTITISKAQHAEACRRVAEAGLEHRVQVLLQDYRDLEGQYDKLVSIEMIEAVGHQYLDQYFRICRHLLKPGGLGLIQAITIEDTRYAHAIRDVDFIKRYIFPGSFIPCNSLMITSAASQGLKLMHLQDIGQSYALTLREWRRRFLAALPDVARLGFDQRFVRMWDFYLCYCEGGFMEGVISDVHLLFEASMPARPA